MKHPRRQLSSLLDEAAVLVLAALGIAIAVIAGVLDRLRGRRGYGD